MSSSLAELAHHLNRCIVTSRHREPFGWTSQESETRTRDCGRESWFVREKVGAGVDGTHIHSTFLLEQEFQSELNQPRVVQLAADNSEVPGAACRTRRAKLDAIKSVEKFGSELKAKPVIRTEIRGFVQRDVPVIDSCAPECGIHTRLIPECPIPRCSEAIWVEPSDSTRDGNVRCALLAARDKIRPQLKVLCEPCF